MSDLHLIPGALATADERIAIDAVVEAPDVRRPARDLLLPALHAAQARAGWISPGALNYICERLQVPPAEAFGVASFYALFALEARAPTVIHVCDDLACRTKGAERICAELERTLGGGGHAAGGPVTWLRSPCLGMCEHAPVAFCQSAGPEPREWSVPAATPDLLIAAATQNGPVTAAATSSAPQTSRADRHGLRLLARVGRMNPESLDDFRALGGYRALRLAFEQGPDRVLREVVESSLLGRGGAAFPTGRKWEAVARAMVRPHYLVCNADESEPGTFKDRVLMEEDPFALIEAMTIAGFATGCERGFLYVRGEYPLALARMENAVAQARRRGLLGANILGQGVSFDIEIRKGAGAYICGEETALFNSIEGYRGEPRNKPPFPVHVGLFGKPTVVNNVETLLNVPFVVEAGGPAFTRVGTSGSTGTKLFCVSGAVAAPGVYEVPFGVTLRHLVGLAGGVADGRALQAVLLGGAAGVFVGPDEIDLPLTFEATRQASATLGSGVVMVFDDRADIGDLLLRIARFFRDESCGQCVPCRVGTVRQEEALARLAGGREPAQQIALIDDLAQAMRDASICGLGHTASGAIQSALRKLSPFARRPA